MSGLNINSGALLEPEPSELMFRQWKRLSRGGRECKSTFVLLYHHNGPGLGGGGLRVLTLQFKASAMAPEGDTRKSFPDQRGGFYLINVVKQTGKAEIRMQMLLLLPLIQTPTLPNIY